ncbi:MAG: putative metal-binding motif-containing protein [Kofleriaceae bacterium]
MKKLLLGLVLASLGAACGGDDGPGGHDLFTPKPECTGDAVTPYAGTMPQVINTLAIGAVQDGFDLDGDNKPDNKLSAVSSLAMSAISDSLKNYDIIIPLEYFDLPTVAADTCVKFAIYYGDFDKDKDGDDKRPGIDGGDCDDTSATNAPGMPEIAGDGIDNDCDGLADENGQNEPSGDTADADGDGQTIADGDCNDHNNTIKKGAAEICGDGLDNDCDGVADRSHDAQGNATACSPFDTAHPVDLALDPLSFDGTTPLISFKDGTIDSAMKLVAGPSLFSVNIPVAAGITLDLRISGATIEGTIGADGSITHGRLGGVIDAKTADTIRGLSVDQIGLEPENSLLDAVFANLLGPLLALPKAGAGVVGMYPGCRTPDIDVDGDGLEAFCDSDPNDDIKTVDVCIDGDGTVVKDAVDGSGNVTMHCTEALKDGKPRFVDGISVELNFTTTPVHSLKMP